MTEPARASSVVYPSSDGRPMGETGRHGLALMDLVMLLRDRFADQPEVYVGGNQFLYWSEGDPTQVVCPDVYVAVGRPRDPPRDTWLVWEEGPPTFVLELTSRSSRVSDVGAKRGLYAALGVREYAVFDPLGEYLRPRLRLWRLPDVDADADADAEPADAPPYVEVPAGPHGLWSEVLDAWLGFDDLANGELLRLRARDGARVLRGSELARVESERADAADERAVRAEAERDALLAELERLRRG